MSELAERLLQLHARRPDHVFYGVDVLGSLYRDADVQRLDQAYAELVGSRYMEPAGVVVSYFGAPKALHRITSDGLSAAAQQSAA